MAEDDRGIDDGFDGGADCRKLWDNALEDFIDLRHALVAPLFYPTTC